MIDNKRHMILQLFAGEGAGAGGAGGEAGPDAGIPAEAPKQQMRRSSGEDLSQVQYGIQAQDDGSSVEIGQQRMPDDAARQEGKLSFRDLIKSDEYKAEADKYIQDVIKRRIGDSKAQQQLLDKSTAFIDKVAMRYGMDASDLAALDFDALSAKLDQDTAYLEERAAENGVTVEVQKQLDRMEQQNRLYQRREAMTRQEQESRAAFTALAQQAEAFKAIVPDFDLMAEMENEAFRRMVMPPNMRGSGLSIEQAYFGLHGRDILSAGMQSASRKARETMSNAIRSGMNRPSENGTATSRAVDARTDPSKFKKSDFAEIDKRVARGEKISF